MSQRSTKRPLPKSRSNDWVEVAGACLKVRDILRQQHGTLHKFVMEHEAKKKDLWLWVPACEIERMYADGMRAMEILRHALKGR